jgi:hypothetical protein
MINGLRGFGTVILRMVVSKNCNYDADGQLFVDPMTGVPGTMMASTTLEPLGRLIQGFTEA